MTRKTLHRLLLAATAAITCACYDTSSSTEPSPQPQTAGSAGAKPSPQPQTAGSAGADPSPQPQTAGVAGHDSDRILHTAGTAANPVPEVEEPLPTVWQLERTVAGLAFGNETFVAVGSELRSGEDRRIGVIYTSKDGATWSKAANELPGPVVNVAFGNGRFVATGALFVPEPFGTPVIQAYVATDARQWTAVPLPNASPSDRIAFGRDMFVVPVKGAHAQSNEGLEWGLFGTTVQAARSVEFANGRFVSWAERSGRLDVLDGDAWEAVDVALGGTYGYSFHTIRALTDRFVALVSQQCCMGERPPTWALASSSDGRSWQVDGGGGSSNRPSLPLLATEAFCVANSTYEARGLAVLVGRDCDSVAPTFADDAFSPRTAVYADDVLLVAGEGGIVRSNDEGRNWTRVLWNE